MKRISLLILFLVSSSAFAKPLALVWVGPGACKPGCVGSAIKVARQSGFEIKRIRPGFSDYALFKKAKLWVQPGGKSTTAAASMGPLLMDQVRQFVFNGGGYVGYCAGAFIATSQIGTSGKIGYGIIPGSTELLIKEGKDHAMLPMKTEVGNFKMYYAGGPYLHVNESELKAVNGRVIARYADGKVAGVYANYGKGRVAVVGTHPEASFFWKAFKGVIDLRSERFFARRMVRSVTE